MSSMEELLAGLTDETSSLEAAALEAARVIRDAVLSFGDLVGSTPTDATRRPGAGIFATATDQGVSPAEPRIEVSPAVTNRFEITLQTDLQDPAALANRLAEALDLVFTRKTGLAISDALRQVKSDLARRSAAG